MSNLEAALENKGLYEFLARPGTVYRHKKSGHHYRVQCLSLQEDTMEVLVTYYRLSDPKLKWTRKASVFLDGRFERLMSTPLAGVAVHPGEDRSDPYHTKEDGWIEFYVVAWMGDRWELEVKEYGGCAFWMQEGMGIDWWLNETFGEFDLEPGYTYKVQGLQVYFIKGDGWTTDDDEEWTFSEPILRSGSRFRHWTQRFMNWLADRGWL